MRTSCRSLESTKNASIRVLAETYVAKVFRSFVGPLPIGASEHVNLNQPQQDFNGQSDGRICLIKRSISQLNFAQSGHLNSVAIDGIIKPPFAV